MNSGTFRNARGAGIEPDSPAVPDMPSMMPAKGSQPTTSV